MQQNSDVVILAQRLVAIDTVNPPGNEDACMAVLGPLLADAGFRVEPFAHAPGRTSLVARYGAEDPDHALCFVGHLDTVPLGKTQWAVSPFGAEIVDGRLYGRGACDMKAGVAAMVCAALHCVKRLPPEAELVLVLVAGEETGCEGSSFVAEHCQGLAGFDGIIVGEPTDNGPLVGHKGAFWVQAMARGRSAHGATPEAGHNAIFDALEMVGRLRHFCDQRTPHPALGRATLNVGTFHAGENVNSVPDRAEIGVDIRTVPGIEHDQLKSELETLLAPQLDQLSVRIDLPSVYTDPGEPWVKEVFRIVEEQTGRRPTPRTANYFTDASALVPVVGGAPILILGPGRPEQMHQVDEYCEIDRIHEAVAIYESIIDRTLVTAVGAPTRILERSLAQ